MLSVYPSEGRGLANFGWHTSHYTFSFGTFYRPKLMGYGALRALNEHRVMPGEEFSAQNHRDMEILSYVVEGAMAVGDSTGREVVVRAGEILRMSAGTGVVCRESNNSAKHPLVAIQLWVIPERPCLASGYEHRPVPIDENPNRWCLVGSREGRSRSVMIHQEVNLYMAKIMPGHGMSYETIPGRQGWVHIMSGSITLNDKTLVAGDGVAFKSDLLLSIHAVDQAEILLVDLQACHSVEIPGLACEML